MQLVQSCEAQIQEASVKSESSNDSSRNGNDRFDARDNNNPKENNSSSGKGNNKNNGNRKNSNHIAKATGSGFATSNYCLIFFIIVVLMNILFFK
jgi:hypothetical protein